MESINATILSRRISQGTIPDRSFCPENNHKIITFPVFNQSPLAAHKFCQKLGSRLFAPITQEEFDFFWRITARSKAMVENCDTGGRKLMHLGIVKLLGPDNKTIPECPYPLDDAASHKHRCIMGINMYTKQEHSGFNVNTVFKPGEQFPILPENATSLAGRNVSKQLEMMNIHTPEDILANAFRISGSYTKDPYPGHTFYWLPTVPKFSWPLCTPCHPREVLAIHPVLKVRGLCSQTAFDQEYTMLNDEDGYVKYVGTQNSIIIYNSEEQIWKMKSLPLPKITATSKAPFTSLLVG